LFVLAIARASFDTGLATSFSGGGAVGGAASAG
jgi:hypothetical protein